MFTKLSDSQKAAVFSILLLSLAVVAAVLIRVLDLSSNEWAWASIWEITPLVAVLLMLLVLTREGYSKQGWRSLGLHSLGLRVWWTAFFGTLLITICGSLVVWASPIASVRSPEGGVVQSVVSFLAGVVILTLSFSLTEEIGIRGYLLPKLMPLGRNRALLLSGLVWATWHMPLIFLTTALPVGTKLIAVPLFYATIVAASFFYGYLRIYSGSLWPAAIAHAVHNQAWTPLLAFTATSAPGIVSHYLVGDSGILIFIGAAVAAALVRLTLIRRMDREQRVRGAAPVRVAAPAAVSSRG
jgi:CAAX protease family protein